MLGHGLKVRAAHVLTPRRRPWGYAGQLFPKEVPFLTAFRPYAGNWRAARPRLVPVADPLELLLRAPERRVRQHLLDRRPLLRLQLHHAPEEVAPGLA